MNGWLMETLVATTLLMALVLLVRPFIAAKFGARAAYLLWAAPALRMILPPLPAQWAPAEIAPVRDAVVILAGTSSHPVEAAAVTGGGVAWPMVLLTVWLGGAALFFAAHWLAYLRFAAGVDRQGEAIDRVDTIPVTRSAAVASPIAIGVFGRRVIVPLDFDWRFDADERRLALAHELIHHRRFDVAANFFALAMLALHWWNPLAHIAHRAFRLDQEAACDDLVLDGASADDRYAYGSAMFKSAMGRVPLAACAMGATATLKHRLRRIVAAGGGRTATRKGFAGASAMVLSGVVLTASATAVPVVAVEQEPEMVIVQQAPVQTAAVAVPAAPKAPKAPKAPAAPRAAPAVPAPSAVEAPAPPEPPLPPAGFEAVAVPAAPAPPAHPAVLACPTTGKVRVAYAVSGDGEQLTAMRVVSCAGHAVDRKRVALEALKSARIAIAREITISEAQRVRALAALDSKIERLSQETLPPLIMQ